MVVEADESDGTFIQLPTEIGVVTNIDPEHLDYYGTEAALHEAFLTFLRQIPKDGLAVPGIDHPVVRSLLNRLDGEGCPAADGLVRPRARCERQGQRHRHEWRHGDLRRHFAACAAIRSRANTASSSACRAFITC